MMPAKTVKRLIRPLMPRGLRPRRILWGPLRGTRIVASWHDYPAALLGYTETSLVRWFETTVRPGDTWLDVGAHYGYTALALARLVGRSGRIFAFEPVADTARCLAETRRLNDLSQLRVVTLGLSDCAEVTPIETALVRGMAQTGSGDGEGRAQISVAALDRIWPDLAEGDERVHGVKLDVQGMELRALEGMASLLATHHPVLAIEFHDGVDRDAIIGLLRSCGYDGRGELLGPAPGESEPKYADDQTYVFSVESRPC